MIEKKPKQGGWLKHVIGLAISLVCLLFIARQVDFAEALEALHRFYWPYLGIGLASLALGYSLRIMRWSLMLRSTGAAAGFQECSAPFLGSIALNNVLPFRMGDVVRAFVFPKAMGITKTTAMSSLAVERLVDLMALIACLAIGLYQVQNQVIDIPDAIRFSAVYLALFGGIALTLGILFSGKLARFFHRLSGAGGSSANSKLKPVYATLGALLHSFEMMSRPRLLFLILAMSMLIWLGESGLFYFVALGLDIDATPTTALLVMSVATLSTLAPSSPGYVGPFHLAAFTAISLVGGTAAQAGSYAVLVHLALWTTTTIAGAFAIYLRPQLFRGGTRSAEDLDEQLT